MDHLLPKYIRPRRAGLFLLASARSLEGIHPRTCKRSYVQKSSPCWRSAGPSRRSIQVSPVSMGGTMGYMAGVHEVPDLDLLVEEVTESCSILQKSALLAEEAGYIGETAWTPPWGTASSALGTCRRCIEFHMNVPSSALRFCLA